MIKQDNYHENSTFKNMKFKVDSPEQSERLQKVLFGLGYAWQCCDASVLHTNAEILFVDDTGRLTYIPLDYDGYFNRHHAEEQDTEAFLAAHELKVAKELSETLKDMQETLTIKQNAQTEAVVNHPDGHWLPPEGDWFDNTGTEPDLPEGTKINVLLRSDDPEGIISHQEQFVHQFNWTLDEYLGEATVAKWRYHRSEKPEEYFVQPKTEPKLDAQGNPRIAAATYDDEGNMLSLKVGSLSSLGDTELGIMTSGGIDSPKDFGVDWLGNVQPKTEPKLYELAESMKEIAQKYQTCEKDSSMQSEKQQRTIDSHYNFSYQFSEVDKLTGTIKIDPYFVSQQWKLGSKDSTGIVFHCLKTIARFGDKNSKEREINALHKSIIRLAQLEGVELK